MFHRTLLLIALCLIANCAHAGMPAPLPTNWKMDSTPKWAPSGGGSYDGSADARWQAISFFVAGLLLSAWGVQWLWRTLRKDLAWLPALSYRRSLSFVVLWGLLFVIVLTMISGARELMTPGAWRKQGWTYQLASAVPSSTASTADARQQRRAGLEQLRLALWQYAATHEGRFPSPGDAGVDPLLWEIPGWPGVKFIAAPDRKAEEAGRLLVCEPELDGDERQVLLTNGLIGSMRTREIREALAEGAQP